MPYKIRPANPRDRDTFLKIGRAIIAAWRGANGSVDLIDVAHLRSEILRHLDPNNPAGTGRVVDVGLIFDENLDRQTRFVWLAIPTPDVKRRNGVDDNWERYINDTFTTDADVEELGESILFGCGR